MGKNQKIINCIKNKYRNCAYHLIFDMIINTIIVETAEIIHI